MSLEIFSESTVADNRLTLEDTLGVLVLSIASEWLRLSKLMNAETEKIEALLMSTSSNSPKGYTINNLEKLKLNMQEVFQDILMEEMLLQMKLQRILCCLTASDTQRAESNSPVIPDQLSEVLQSIERRINTVTINRTSTTSTTTTTSTTATSTTTTTSTTGIKCDSSTTAKLKYILSGYGYGYLPLHHNTGFIYFTVRVPKTNDLPIKTQNSNSTLIYKALLLPREFYEQSLTMVADPSTLSFEYTEDTLVISGSGTESLRFNNEMEISGPVTFRYLFQNKGLNSKYDKVGISIFGIHNPNLSFSTQGLSSMTGYISIEKQEN